MSATASLMAVEPGDLGFAFGIPSGSQIRGLCPGRDVWSAVVRIAQESTAAKATASPAPQVQTPQFRGPLAAVAGSTTLQGLSTPGQEERCETPVTRVAAANAMARSASASRQLDAARGCRLQGSGVVRAAGPPEVSPQAALLDAIHSANRSSSRGDARNAPVCAAPLYEGASPNFVPQAFVGLRSASGVAVRPDVDAVRRAEERLETDARSLEMLRRAGGAQVCAQRATTAQPAGAQARDPWARQPAFERPEPRVLAQTFERFASDAAAQVQPPAFEPPEPWAQAPAFERSASEAVLQAQVATHPISESCMRLPAFEHPEPWAQVPAFERSVPHAAPHALASIAQAAATEHPLTAHGGKPWVQPPAFESPEPWAPAPAFEQPVLDAAPPQAFEGLRSAGGRAVSVNVEALRRAEGLLGRDNNGEEPAELEQVVHAAAPQAFEGLRSAGGRAVKVDVEALRRAEGLLRRDSNGGEPVRPEHEDRAAAPWEENSDAFRETQVFFEEKKEEPSGGGPVEAPPLTNMLGVAARALRIGEEGLPEEPSVFALCAKKQFKRPRLAIESETASAGNVGLRIGEEGLQEEPSVFALCAKKQFKRPRIAA